MTDFPGAALGAKPHADGPRLRILVHHWSGPPKHGLLRLEGDALFLEYDAGVIAGWFGTRYKEVRISLEDLESVRLEKKEIPVTGRPGGRTR